MYLAIDYGKKRCGISVSDAGGLIAFRLNTIVVKNQNQLVDDLKKIIESRDIKKILLGLPLGVENKPTQMSLEIEKFGKILVEKTGCEIIYTNESMTSLQAKQNSFAKDIDSESARLFLQEYLDHQNSK